METKTPPRPLLQLQPAEDGYWAMFTLPDGRSATINTSKIGSEDFTGAIVWNALAEILKTLESKPVSLAEMTRLNVSRNESWDGHKNWTPAHWGLALAGETGELCNIIKKRFRDGETAENHRALADEIADVFTYLLLLAHYTGVDLEQAYVRKFNEVSEKRGFPHRADEHTSPAIEAAKPADDPSQRVARLANAKMLELGISYSEAARYVLQTQPDLAREYRDYTLRVGASVEGRL